MNAGRAWPFRRHCPGFRSPIRLYPGRPVWECAVLVAWRHAIAWRGAYPSGVENLLGTTVRPPGTAQSDALAEAKRWLELQISASDGDGRVRRAWSTLRRCWGFLRFVAVLSLLASQSRE